MKKLGTKKLALSGERVRVLTVDQLQAVAGAGATYQCPHSQGQTYTCLTSGKPSCAAH